MPCSLLSFPGKDGGERSEGAPAHLVEIVWGEGVILGQFLTIDEAWVLGRTPADSR